MEGENKTILYQKYNYDNVFNRSVIAGLLYLLNHKLTYEQVWDDNVVETVTVPFAYNFAQSKDQRFVQDNYTFFGRECFSDKLIDGKFDMFPRFAITYTGSTIESSNITNRFVKGTYMKDNNGVLTSYTAFMYSIPLTLSFELEGWIDTLETAFKIEQAIRDTFYKNQTFNVLFRGMKIGCRAGFPENYNVAEKTVSYSFEQDSQLFKMSFNLAVETYQPCFDETQSVESDKKIEAFGFDPLVLNNGVNENTKDIVIKFNKDDIKQFYVAGQTIELSWESISNISDVYSVLLYYVTEDSDKHLIDNLIRQHNYYDWVIPENLSSFKQPYFTLVSNTIDIIKQPKLFVYPNNRGIVDTGCFGIINPGEFKSDGLVQVCCEYIDSSSNTLMNDCYVAIVENHKVVDVKYYTDTDFPEEFIVNKKKINLGKDIKPRKISIVISYIQNPEIYDIIDNVLII